MIRSAGDGLKGRFGRVAYVWTGSQSLRMPFRAQIKVNGVDWYKEGQLHPPRQRRRPVRRVEVFEDARPDDGMLELGVVSADGLVQWARTLTQTALGKATKSPFDTTKGNR
jgi:diacylglycerol kinase family enzyme